MGRFHAAERVLVVETFYENKECATQTMRKLRTSFDRNEASCGWLMTKFETTGSVLTAKLPVWKRQNEGIACSCARKCHCESGKINSPTFAAVGYLGPITAANFA